MARVELKGVHKFYGETHVVRGIDLAIHDGEFVALLGPSGCGKTTTLRLIAGLESPTKGELIIGDDVVSSAETGVFVPPEKRRLGMVFQSYAVWPHMNVAKNVGYPLKLAGQGSAERKEAVKEALAMVQLDGLGERMPNQLSGGQQQRVALARALVMRPQVLLLDEPLSNLDAHLRVELRREIDRIRKEIGVTVVYVTHDQEEALALADRIVVMSAGKVRQVGPPDEVYRAPGDDFVGGFIGKANFLSIKIKDLGADAVQLELEDGRSLALDRGSVRFSDDLKAGAEVRLMVRPEAVSLATGAGDVSAQVLSVTYLGDRLEVLLGLGGDRLRTHVEPTAKVEVGAEVGVDIKAARIFAQS